MKLEYWNMIACSINNSKIGTCCHFLSNMFRDRIFRNKFVWETLLSYGFGPSYFNSIILIVTLKRTSYMKGPKKILIVPYFWFCHFHCTELELKSFSNFIIQTMVFFLICIKLFFVWVIMQLQKLDEVQRGFTPILQKWTICQSMSAEVSQNAASLSRNSRYGVDINLV